MTHYTLVAGKSQAGTFEFKIYDLCVQMRFESIGMQVLYQGKAASLGIKQSNPPNGRWSELAITKCPKITHISLGHDGLHALLVAEDGSVYFVGTARRGEDGDTSGGMLNVYVKKMSLDCFGSICPFKL